MASSARPMCGASASRRLWTSAPGLASCQSLIRRAQKKWGPAFLPAPTAPSEGFAGLIEPDPARNPLHKPRLTSSGIAFHRRIARRAIRRCSAALLGLTSLASRFASFPEGIDAASRDRKINSSGASSRPASVKSPGGSPQSPAGGDRSFCRLPLLPAVAGPLERRGLPSRSPEHHAPARESLKAKNMGASLWITWISGTTVGTFRQLRFSSGKVAASFRAAYLP